MGRAVSLRLAAEGVQVHLVGRTRSKLQDVADEIARAGGRSAMFEADVTKPGSLDHLAAAIDDGLDILVHCAGESLMRSLEETSLEEWQRTIDVNLTSAFLTTQTLLPALRASQNPSIVLVSSKTALKGYPVVVYSAAKAGVLGFARALAAELAPEHIRVVPVCPGPTDTPMRWSSTPDMERQLVMDVGAIADTVSYIAGLPRGVAVDTLLVQAAQYD
jgi:NAD(P)-dependent dehydrogenase (short-subunit alcohol dehydrogenase family)